jgi:elongation factor P
MTIPLSVVEDKMHWIIEEVLYDIVVYKGQPIDVQPPTFLEMTITETTPGARGDTSGRVMKAATTNTGAKIQIPIFVNEGDKIKVDTRTAEYVSRI